MKRLFAAIFCLIFGLGLSGCSSSPAPDIHTYDLGGNEQIKLLKDTYAKKWVPLFVRAGFYREIYRGDKFMDTMSGGRSDCFGLINGNNDGGDLLTSLAEDPDSRIFAELKLYKSSYIASPPTHSIHEFITTINFSVKSSTHKKRNPLFSIRIF
jgi:hypothetical protein